MTHICVSRQNHHWFRKWLGAWSVPSHYLNQCWNIVNWNLRSKLQWNLKQNSYIFIQENAFENVVWKMSANLSRRKWFNIWLNIAPPGIGSGLQLLPYSAIIKDWFNTKRPLALAISSGGATSSNIVGPALAQVSGVLVLIIHDDVIKWNPFPRYWPFVRGINRSPVKSPHKDQWHRVLVCFLYAPGQTIE